jgi:hypothetical protein
LEDARRVKHDADAALRQATYNLDIARRAKSDADAALQQAKDYYAQIVAWGQGVSVIGPFGYQTASDVGRRLNEASGAIPPAQMRVTLADQAVGQAEGAFSAAQSQVNQATAQLQAEERRQQILAKLGVHCEDPQTAEETRQCESDYFNANFGGSQANFRADLGPELSRRYDDLRAAEQRDREKKARAEAEQNYETEVAKNRTYQETHGYKSISFNDFLLDGKELAESQSKVSVAGVYKRNGAFTALFSNQMAILQDLQNINIPMLTEDATREIRSYFLRCDENQVPIGCPITVLGTATMCTKTNLVGSSEVPCIKVEDGWNVAPPR